MIYSVDQIRHVHLELSSRCNAECPMCPRNLYGYPFNMGYREHDMTLAEAEQIFQPAFVSQLTGLLLNGNLGDAVMNPDTVAIIEYFKQHSPDIEIMMSTNGGARSAQYWQDLARLGVYVFFCLDGLEDTHSLYRRNTLYSTVLRNAQIFIAAGGAAAWKFITFDHNRHQLETARQLSEQLGFRYFHAEPDQSRIASPVFDSSGSWQYNIGQPGPDFTAKTISQLIQGAERLRNHTQEPQSAVKQPIQCEVKQSRSVYVNSLGHVYPCCYIGHNPETFWGRQSHQLTRPLIQNNSALEHTLEQCIKWFDRVEHSWDQPTFAQGRLVECNQHCGGCATEP